MSEFSELIKHLHRVRDFIRNFYLFDWRERSDYEDRSSRTYDNERRRIESLFNEYVKSVRIRSGFAEQSRKGRKSLMINATDIARNPLYEVWRAKRFTPSDILLHFTILDEGAKKGENGFTKQDIVQRVLDMTSTETFLWSSKRDMPSDSTIGGKLKEYESAGLLVVEGSGRATRYVLASPKCDDLPEEAKIAVNFFSEALPFGEIGDHIREEAGWTDEIFRFKHHFIAHTLDDEVLYDLLTALRLHCRIQLMMDRAPCYIKGVPCKILVSVQTGRRYIGMREEFRDGTFKFIARRLDYIKKAYILGVEKDHEDICRKFEAVLDGAWGVSFGADQKEPPKLEKVEMKLCIDEQTETYVLDRLNREGRKGKIERLEKNIFLYSHAIWDSNEMMPFVLSFTGRTLSFKCENEKTEERFREEMKRMTSMYLGR
jgi:hypothetical protein